MTAFRPRSACCAPHCARRWQRGSRAPGGRPRSAPPAGPRRQTYWRPRRRRCCSCCASWRRTSPRRSATLRRRALRPSRAPRPRAALRYGWRRCSRSHCGSVWSSTSPAARRRTVWTSQSGCWATPSAWRARWRRRRRRSTRRCRRAGCWRTTRCRWRWWARCGARWAASWAATSCPTCSTWPPHRSGCTSSTSSATLSPNWRRCGGRWTRRSRS
mmetsp:Transcript_40904/g.103653  ORF Transcript_40904/g.103653 Transcript_40904/m.103653 type:complete len:215 (-) Transcript_40904:843-1487(-)